MQPARQNGGFFVNKSRMRKWRAQKRIPLTKAVAIGRYYLACFWIENIEELLRLPLVLPLILLTTNYSNRSGS